MKDNKGQALVEFVIIIPIFFVILFSAIDLGNVIYKKYHLENDLDYVVDLYRQNKLDEINTYASTKNFVIDIKNSNETATIKLEQYVNINTPGINLVIDSPYKISVDRVIYDEK